MDKIIKTIVGSLITVFTAVVFILMSTTLMIVMWRMLDNDSWNTRAIMGLTATMMLFWTVVGILYLPNAIMKFLDKEGKKDGS